MHKNAKKKMHFTHHLIIHLTVQSRSALENAFDGEPRDVLRDLHKDAQKSACDVAQKGHLRLHLNCTCFCTYIAKTVEGAPKISLSEVSLVKKKMHLTM